MSEFLKEYRVKNPQYSDLDDNQLVTALHGKYNSDKGASLSLDDFSKAIEYQPIQQEPIGQPDSQSLEVDSFTGAARNVEPPYQGPVAKAWEPTLWEQIKSLGTSDSKKARAMNEFAIRQMAKERGVPVKQIYKEAGFIRPLINPEGRAGVQAFTEGATILGKQTPEIPQGVVNSVLRVIRGGDETVEDTWLDDAINYTEPSKPENTDPNYAPFYGVGKSLGTSLTSITASAIVTALAAETGPFAPAAGAAASVAVAYRSSKDEFIERIKTIINDKSEKINGRPVNQEEWDKALIEYDAAATKYGAWEAIPEALSNMVFLRALAAPMKGLGKKALEDVSKRAAKVMLSEQVTETITGVGQSGAEAEAGIGEQKTVGEAFREQVVQTGIITGLMGAGAGGGKYIYETVEENLAPERVIAKEMEVQLRKVNPDLTETELAEKFASPIAQEIYDIKIKPPEQKTIGEMVKEKIYDKGIELSTAKPAEKIEIPQEISPAAVIKEEETNLLDQTVVIDENITKKEKQKLVEKTKAPKKLSSLPRSQIMVEMNSIIDSGAARIPKGKKGDTPVIFPDERHFTDKESARLKLLTDEINSRATKEEAEELTESEFEGIETVEAPIDEITISKDVPQFKEGADTNGVVEGLGGKFDRVGVSPVQIWVRNDGSKEVISGRHRLDLAKRSGEETIPAQYHYEVDGFNAAQAAGLDAILNIREGQGKVKDYVEFIKSSKPTREEADAQGILARATGQRAYAIATTGSDLLITAHKNDQITDEAATRIAKAAPNSEKLQSVGIKAIQEGKTISIAENLIKAVKSMTTETKQSSGDLFGQDDSAMVEAQSLASKASKKQLEISRSLSAITGAAKRPDLAAKEGVKVSDPKAVKARIAKLKEEKRKWENWHTNPSLVAELKGKKRSPEKKKINLEVITKKDSIGFSSEIKQNNPSVKFSFSARNDVITLDKIVVPKDVRETGVGTKAMNDIASLADKQGKTIALTPTADFGGTKKRLNEFYKRFGFVENKGKNKNFEISELMYREPNIKQKTKSSEQLKPKTEKSAPKIANMKVITPPKGQDGVKIDVQKQEVSGAKVEVNGKKTAAKGNSAKSNSSIFNAPGHNYVGLHRSTGIPERRDSVDIDGKTVRIPGKVQRIEPIIRSLTKIMGRRVYFGKIKGKSAEGFYRPSVGEIRTKKKNDVEVLAHEMAHYLDMYTDPKLPSFKNLYKDSKYNEEVKALSYTDDTVKLQEIEGFAEFVRLWLTNSTEAQTRAPNFYKAFGRVLNRHGKLGKQMRTMQEQMHKFYFQGADKLGQALIGDEGTFAGKFNQWVYRRDSRIRQQMIDRFHAARKIEQELTGKISETSASAWKQFRVANGGYEGISDYVLNYGTLNFNENGDLVKTGESLHDVLSPIKSINLKEKHKGEAKIDLLMRYFAGRRALELHSQKRENLIPKETAKEWARLGKDYPVFDDVFKSYQAFNSRMMDFYQDAGLITPEARKTIQKMNKDYVPFNRIRETLITGKPASGGGFQRLRGGTANLNDILVNMQDGITANIKQALNNKAKARLYQYISGYQDGAIFATKIAPDSKPVKVYLNEMEAKIGKVLEEAGIILDGELDLSSPDLLTFWQHGVKPQLNESGNIVDTVMINGKPKYYEVQDPLLQEMLLAMNPESYSSFMNVMFGIKNIFTRTITLGIEFIGANLVRDTMGATFISKNGFKPFITSFKGMYSFFKKDKHFQDFMRSGGGYSSRIEASTREGKARRRVAVDEFGVMSLPEKLLSAFDHFSSAFEYGTRIGEYRLAKKNGATDMDAAYAAREISTDFSVLGANRFLTGYIRTIPFLNAMVQSQDRVYREALVSKRYDGNPAGMAMKAFMGITLPTLVLYLANKDDEEYQKIPDYEKRTNWHIKVGEKRFIKIPRPYDVGFVYATMPELYFKYLEDDKGKEFSDGMLWTLTQMYGVDGTPAALSGWWDIVKNEKWTGAPVVPNALSGVEAPQQYNANTSETFVRLGQALDMSPIKAEHAFKAYTGYLGGYLLWGTNKMLWDDEKFGPQPESDISSNVFLRRFLTPEVRPSTHAMEKFFDLKEKSDEIVATYKANIDVRRALSGKMEKDGRFKGDNFFGLSGKEKEVLFALNDSMNQLIGVIYGKEGIKTAEIKVRYDKDLTAKEKRKRLDSLWASRNKAFMQYYNAANEAMMKAKKESDKFKQENKK